MKIKLTILLAVSFSITVYLLYQSFQDAPSFSAPKFAKNNTFLNIFSKRLNDKKYVTANYTIPGRLGNNLFRFASLYGIGQTLHRYPYFNGNNSLQIEALKEITEAFSFLSEYIEIKVPRQTLTEIVAFSDECCKYEDPENLKKYANVKYLIVGGNFLQSYKFFHKFQNEIKKLMECSKTFKDNAEIIAKRIWKNDSNSHKLCIHVRRGDFADYPMYQETTLDFVTPATKNIYDSLKQQQNYNNISLTILNNDESFSQSLKFPDLVFTSINILQNNSAALDLCFASHYCDSLLMSASASTYAWWIGYLMEKQNNIFYNSKMAKTEEGGKMYFPEDLFLPYWKKLQVLENGTVFLNTN